MGSRKTHDGVEKVYAAAEAWVNCALRSDDSLFTPGRPIWTKEFLGELRRRFLDGPSYPDGSFLDKLQKLLAGSPPNVYQLMAEVLYVHFLIIGPNQMKVVTKENSVNRVSGMVIRTGASPSASCPGARARDWWHGQRIPE